MAVLTGALTLADLKTRLEPSSMRVANIIEILKRVDEVYDDMPFMEGNLLTGHKTVIRTGLPTPTWRLLNQGVAATKSSTSPIEFPCGMLEDRSEIDKDLAELGGDVNGARWSEAQAHLQGMANEFTSTLWYGDPTANPTTDQPKFFGLSSYYKDNTTAQTKDNIIDAGGTNSVNSSIWLVGWSEQSCTGIYPKGSQAGLRHEDLGLGDAFDASTYRFRAYMDRYEWKAGLALPDWRYVVRIANVDTTVLSSTAANQQALVPYMVEALEKLPSRNNCTPVFYMNGHVRTALRLGQRLDVRSGGGLTFDNIAGKMVMNLDGVPVKRSDSILNSEARVT